MSALTIDNRNYSDMIDYYEARIEALERRLRQVEQRGATTMAPRAERMAAVNGSEPWNPRESESTFFAGER